jgi:hypothetical protein
MLLAPVFEKNPFVQIMIEWPAIVGKDLASFTMPQKIVPNRETGDILYLVAMSGKEMEVWASSCLILERVNQYLGYAGLQRIRILK